MAKLYWATCYTDGCTFTGNALEDEGAANEELNAHMHEHAQRGESGGGSIEQSEAE